jgi:hypothetical protein
MVEYKCNNCTKIYTHKGEYKRHINRKIPCTLALSSDDEKHQIPPTISPNSTKKSHIVNVILDDSKENNHKCGYCTKKFSRKDALDRHLNSRCKVKISQDNEKEAIFQGLLAKLEKYETNTQFFVDKIKGLEEQIKVLQSGNVPQITNIDRQQNIDKQQNNITNNNNIKLIAFGQEDLSFIEDNICKKILSKGFMSVPKLLEHVHFNADKPEYHNIYIPNYKNGKVMVHNGSEWGLHDRDDTLDQLNITGCEFIDKKFTEFKEKDDLDEPTIRKLNRFLEERDEEPQHSNIMKELESILYNKRHVVMDTIKKMKTEVKQPKLIEQQ